MNKCDRIDVLCKCLERGVKIKPKKCLPRESYMSCHILCKVFWKKYRWENYDLDKEKQRLYPSCYLCKMQSCWYCKNNTGLWQNDIQKVLCYGCL